MELREGASVFTPSGEEVGRVNRFILDPSTNQVTHVVIQKGWLLPDDKVLPFEMVSSSTDDRLVLHEEITSFEDLPSFEETHFVRVADDDHPTDTRPASDPGYANTPAFYWYPAMSNIGYPGVGLGHFAWPTRETTRNIPEGTVPLQEGTDVLSSDGQQVGNVERLIVDSDAKATHFVISQGALFKDRKLVPAQWVKAVDENGVRLVVPARLLERLPAYEE